MTDQPQTTKSHRSFSPESVSVWLYQCSALHLNRSKRPAQSTEQPADSQRDDGSCVRWSFNSVPQPGIKCGRGLSGDISGLTITILCGAGRLVQEAFGSYFGITGS